VPGSGEGLQQNYSRIDASGKAVALLWRHSADFSTGLALMFTDDIAKGFPSSFDTLAYAQVGNGDVTVTPSNVFVAWQDNNSSKVKFRSGSYEISTGTKEEKKAGLLTFYPNPVSTELMLNTESSYISIMDLSGRILIHGKGNKVDVRPLSEGLYFMLTEAGWGKFVKN
jgi:hypothetical protein